MTAASPWGRPPGPEPGAFDFSLLSKQHGFEKPQADFILLRFFMRRSLFLGHINFETLHYVVGGENKLTCGASCALSFGYRLAAICNFAVLQNCRLLLVGADGACRRRQLEHFKAEMLQCAPRKVFPLEWFLLLLRSGRYFLFHLSFREFLYANPRYFKQRTE